MGKINTCVFISGKGSNLYNLIRKSREYNFPIKIKLIISNNENSKGLVFAKKFSIPFLIINTKKRDYELLILKNIKKYNISLICLAGYMKIVTKNFLSMYRKKIINIHPSLLPKYKGLNTFAKALQNKEKIMGCTVHFVNEKLDSGKIISKKSFYLEDGDNEQNLKYKTQKLEYLAFPEAIIKIFRNN